MKPQGTKHNPISVWYISKYSCPLKYGFASRHFYLAGELNRLGFSTTIISSDSNHLANFPVFPKRYYQENIDGVETWWIQTLRYRGSTSFRRILSWLDFERKLRVFAKHAQAKPDVVIASSLSLFSILNGYLLKRRFGSRLIFEVRDIWPLTLTEEGGFRSWNPFVWFLAWIEKFGYCKADLVVGTMPNLAEHVKMVTGRNIPCACIPIGFDSILYEQAEPLPDGYENDYIPKDKFIIGYAGSIGITNALETVIACAEQMRDHPYVHFLLVGEGGKLGEYKARVSGLPNISFAPKIGKSQVQSLLTKCHVLYFSSMKSKVWNYGQSLNKMIDYMFAGKPIIASYSGYPSMINEAQCGVFVPAEDVEALEKAVLGYAAMPKEELKLIGARGKEWLLINRPHEKLAREYSELFHREEN